MGKSKTRIFRKGINNQLPKITREDAIKSAVKELKNSNLAEAKRYITLFALGAEDLLEANASYESLVAIKNIFGS
jgi:hypothetical protein